MHMHMEHNGAAPVQKSCNMFLFTSQLSPILNNHIDRKHIGIKKNPIEHNKLVFLQRDLHSISNTDFQSTEIYRRINFF